MGHPEIGWYFQQTAGIIDRPEGSDVRQCHPPQEDWLRHQFGGPHEQPWDVSLIFSVRTQWRQTSGRCVALSEDHLNAALSASLQRHYTSDIVQKTTFWA